MRSASGGIGPPTELSTGDSYRIAVQPAQRRRLQRRTRTRRRRTQCQKLQVVRQRIPSCRCRRISGQACTASTGCGQRQPQLERSAERHATAAVPCLSFCRLPARRATAEHSRARRSSAAPTAASCVTVEIASSMAYRTTRARCFRSAHALQPISARSSPSAMRRKKRRLPMRSVSAGTSQLDRSPFEPPPAGAS